MGVAKSNTLPVHGSYMADRYPIATRGRMGAAMSIAGRTVGTLSPLLVGGIAALAGGDEGWRWAFLILSIPCAVVAFFAFRLPEPPRGQFEKKEVLGEVFEDAQPAPISIEAGFARIKQIRTMRAAIIAFSAIGFGLFTVPVMSNLFLEEEYDLGTFGRGIVGTVAGVGVLVTLPFVGKKYDGFYRRDPELAARLVGFLLIPAAVLVPVQFFMPNAVLFAIVGVVPAVLTSAAFAMVGPLIMIVVPYRLRGLGSAIASIYLFFIGAAGGAVLSGLLVNAYGPRTTVMLVYIPATLIGGLLFLRGASSIKRDISVNVAEIREELAEHERQRADPSAIPALQVSHVDFSYGQVQVLFDVGFEVRTGEVLALLGTNGAGKSTILRVVAGLGTPSRGVVRLHGRSITFASPEMRARMGIRMLPGGKGVFGDLTVRENLEMAAFNQRSDRAEVERRITTALELFPELAAARRPAGVVAVGRTAAAPRLRRRAHRGSRHPDHRRAVTRVGADHGRAARRRDRAAARAGHDDHRRRAVVERRGGDRRPGRLPGEGARAVRGSDAHARRTRRPGPGGVPRHRGRLSRQPCWPRGSPSRSSSTASSKGWSTACWRWRSSWSSARRR